MEGIPGDYLQKKLEEENTSFIRIISVGPAGPHPIPETGGLVVPCVVEVKDVEYPGLQSRPLL